MKNSKFYFLLFRFCVIVLFSFFFFLFSKSIFAAQVYFEQKTIEIGINSIFEVKLMLDTENQEVNAIEGKIKFSDNLLELVKINDSNSIINFWVERPQAITNGEISFAGITPGGFSGEKNFILGITFKAKQEGYSKIESSALKILLNDGQGTEVNTSSLPLVISVSAIAPLVTEEIIKDIKPPELFQPQISQNSTLFDGQWFLVFSTQDKESGIDHYEVQETRYDKINEQAWQRASSPYQLLDQTGRSYIFVKAIDRVGNVRVVKLEPFRPILWYEKYLIWFIIIALLISYGGVKLWRKNRQIV